MQKHSFSSPLGPLTVCEKDGRLCALLFSETVEKNTAPTSLLLRAQEELTEYFHGARQEFDLPLCIDGTPFQKAVLGALTCVGYGKSITYGALAAFAGFPRAARAVGNVLHTNPLPILIPCHRVVGAQGLGNFAWGMEKKLYLMRLEGQDV